MLRHVTARSIDSLISDACVKARSMARFAALGIFLASSLTAYAADPSPDNQENPDVRVAQFQLPPAVGSPTDNAAPRPALVQRLTYQYVYGSESEFRYRNNADLDRRLHDEAVNLMPQVNGFIIYRPTNWLESKLALTADRDMLIRGDRRITLPNGNTERRPDDTESLLIDEAFVTLRGFTDPFSFHVGRRNYEDERHWLYDGSLDITAIGFRQGRLRAEASYGREVLLNLDAFRRQVTDRVDTYMLYADYRAFDEVKFAAYTIVRNDLDNLDGRGHLYGLRSIGSPIQGFTYWTEAAILKGRDETRRALQGYGFDVGGTYRIPSLPLSPNFTFGYAVGSGDKNPTDRVNNDFRQTGLQSNELKFAGLSEFKRYGEVLDPELSNLRILTVGVGFRPFRDVSVDFVFHDYHLVAYAESLRNSAVTAEMNQGPRASNDVGSEFDIVLGFRNVLNVQRLGIDFRVGKFFPGDAFRNELANGSFVKADQGAAAVVKFWW